MYAFVLSRGNRDFHLTLGVFTTLRAAQQYLNDQGIADPTDWSPPRSGRNIWCLEAGIFTYTIEAHEIRDEGRVSEHYTYLDAMHDDTPWLN